MSAHHRLNHNLPEILTAFGLPRRLLETRPFVLRSALQSVEYRERQITVSRQLGFFDTACTSDTGWMMYVLGAHNMGPARSIAAHIMHAYWAAERRVHWLTSFDKLDRVPFRELKLLVLDTLFADSGAFRRDRFYEIINHHANVADCSVIVLSNNTLDGTVAQLTIKPDFVLGVRG